MVSKQLDSGGELSQSGTVQASMRTRRISDRELKPITQSSFSHGELLDRLPRVNSARWRRQSNLLPYSNTRRAVPPFAISILRISWIRSACCLV